MRGRPVRDDVAPLPVRLVRADGGHEPRHPALRRRARSARGASGSTPGRGTARRPRMTRDWDVVVVGLGALGSAAAYWASRRTGTPGPRRSSGTRSGTATARREDVSRIIRRSYHRPRLRAARPRARTRRGPRSSARAARRSCSGPAAWTSGPRETAPRRRDRHRRVRAVDDRRGRPVRDARRARDRCAAGRRGGSTTGTSGLFQADAGLADPSRGNVAHRRLAVDTAPCCASARPSRGSTASAGETMRDPRGRGAADRRPGHRRRRRVDQRPARAARRRACRSTVTQEQVSWFTPRGDPALFAPDRFPVWIWMDEPSFYGFPDPRAPGPEDRPGRRRAAR